MGEKGHMIDEGLLHGKRDVLRPWLVALAEERCRFHLVWTGERLFGDTDVSRS